MAARTGIARQRATIGRSSAGVPRTYRTLRTKHSRMRTFLGEAAASCRRLLNSVMVVLGDRLGLHKSGQSSSEVEEQPTSAQ